MNELDNTKEFSLDHLTDDEKDRLLAVKNEVFSSIGALIMSAATAPPCKVLPTPREATSMCAAAALEAAALSAAVGNEAVGVERSKERFLVLCASSWDAMMKLHDENPASHLMAKQLTEHWEEGDDD